MARNVTARIFRHGMYDGRHYWVEMWEDTDGAIRVQRISIRGVGEYKDPLGPLSNSRGAIDELMVAARRFVRACFAASRERERLQAMVDLDAHQIG